MIATNQLSNAAGEKKTVAAKWQRIILLCMLGYEALGCLAGGVMLVAKPDGSLMKMPVELMHGAFRDFLIPGIILFALGVLNSIAFFAVLRRTSRAWLHSGLALGGLATWFWVEIAILEELHWLHAMWGLPVVAGICMALSLYTTAGSRKMIMLWCGVIASLLYAAINIIVAAQWEGYSLLSHTPSELSAIHAPTRVLWTVLAAPYTLFMILFSLGVWQASAGNRALRITGALLIAYSSLGFLWPFAPMHLREELAAGGGTFSDTMHLALAAATQIIYFAALWFAAFAFGRSFRMYSVITFFLLLFFGVLTFLEAPDVSKNLPTPFIGLWERINIGLFLVWVIVLSVVLMKREKAPGDT